ncbi:MAG: hypothetical protein MUF58_22615 [Arcicella sp.]|jgi:hypothetical protein|nr:hypothetical protein [Arcicella sp.]
MKTFKDNLNTAVITTQYILNKKSPILFVNHYDDGFWEFLGIESNLKDEDFKIISLDEIIQIDSSILEVSDLPYEGKAYRENINSPWIISTD